MARVGIAGLVDGVIVDVDDVVEHAHGDADGALDLLVVEFETAAGGGFMCATRFTEPRLQNRDFRFVGVQRDLGAQVRAVDHTDVLLRRRMLHGSLNVIQGGRFRTASTASCATGSAPGIFLNSFRSPLATRAS